MIEKLLSVIAPHECLGCGVEGRLLCSGCVGALPAIPQRCYRCRKISSGYKTCTACRRASRLTSVRAVSYHDGLAKELVWKLKFESAQAAANEMATQLAALLPDADDLIITHVPTATARVRQRGYDQARLLARSLASQSGMPYASLLRRSGQHQQVGASRRERTLQLKDAYRVISESLIRETHIILVDDVLTTGATLEAAAAALKTAGAKRVDGVVFTQA